MAGRDGSDEGSEAAGGGHQGWITRLHGGRRGVVWIAGEKVLATRDKDLPQTDRPGPSLSPSIIGAAFVVGVTGAN